MTGQLLWGFRAAALLSMTIVVLAGGCDHSRSTPEGAIAASDEVSQVSQPLIGKRITIRGKFSLLCKDGACVLLDHQVVHLEPRGSFTWGRPYSEMEGKLVAATGTLRFYHSREAKPYAERAIQIPPDHFYFEAESTQVRLIGP